MTASLDLDSLNWKPYTPPTIEESYEALAPELKKYMSLQQFARAVEWNKEHPRSHWWMAPHLQNSPGSCFYTDPLAEYLYPHDYLMQRMFTKSLYSNR